MVTQKYLLTEILAFNYCVTLEQLPCADGKVDDLSNSHTGHEVRCRVVAKHDRDQHERPEIISNVMTINYLKQIHQILKRFRRPD